MLISLSTPNLRSVQALLGAASLFALATPAALSQFAPQQSPPTLQLQAPLVLEDVVVQDSKNQPVHDLKAADFTITDDGKAVTPQSFEEHAAPTPAEETAQRASLPKMPSLGVNVFTNYTPTPTDSPLNILLLDTVNTPMTDQARVRRQMLKYLDDQPAGERIAVFGLGSRLYLLQGFTADPAVLKAAINARTSSAQISPLLDASVDGDTAFGLYNGTFFAAPASTAGDIEKMAGASITERVDYTVAALDQLAHYLSALPGRKNLIWFSAAFPIFIPPDLSLAPDGILTADSAIGSIPTPPFDVEAQYQEQVREVDDLLARSHATLYPVDARGLFANTGAEASHKDNGGPHPIANPTGAKNNFLASEADFLQDLAQEHETLDQMAYETGGKAFYNTADLKSAVERAIAFGSNYYTFSYTPPSGKWDGKYHKIEVKVNRPGLHLSYRRGYFADDPAVDSHGKRHPPVSAMQTAMLHGAPQPSELLFDARVVPDDATTDKLAPGSHPDPKLMQPPYRSFTLDTLLDIHFVQMARASNGEYQGTLEVTVLVYNDKGEVVNTKTRIGHLVLPPNRYADLLAHGLPASQSIDVPVKGTYFIRIGMRDPASNRIGAVEIPVASLQSKQAMIAATTRTPAAPAASFSPPNQK